MSEEMAVVPRTDVTHDRADTDAVREFLAFDVASERYALPLSCVREIVRVPPVTEVPRSPETVLGIISVRGTVTTVIDLRRKLRVPVEAISVRSRILIIDGGNERTGLLVDAVLQVHRLREQEVELASVLGGNAPPYLVGIGRPGSAAPEAAEKERARTAGEMLLLLDPIALLKS
jgi:purine-binding chemotaxis protein CheW